MNKNIVAGLQARGVNALGLTGADMNVIRSMKRPVKEVDYGFVGDVERVDSTLLSDLIHKGVVPVMAPLTHDDKGICSIRMQIPLPEKQQKPFLLFLM